MSSIRNAVPRRPHKERSQPSNRSKFGILEKHKDYVVRARDFHKKQATLGRLREIAAERNRDEFYFGMVKGRTKDGVHIQDRGNPVLPPEVVKLLKTQDANYVRTQLAANQRKIDELKQQLMELVDLEEGLADEERDVLREAGMLASQRASSGKGKKAGKGKHVVFAESEAQARAYRPPSPSRLRYVSQPGNDVDMNTPSLPLPSISPEALGWLPSSSKPQNPADAVNDADTDAPSSADPGAYRMSLLTHLSARLLRSRQLSYALAELELQKMLFTKGRPRKVREAVEVKDSKGEDEDEEEEEEEGRGSRRGRGGERVGEEETMWKPRVFKWKFMRRK